MSVFLRNGARALELGAAPSTPAAGARLIYPKSDGWYEKDSAGVERKVSPSGTKISALTAVTTPAGTDEFVVNQAGTSKKMTLTQINAYTEPVSNASVALQTIAGADTYLTDSAVVINPTRLQAHSFYRCKFNVVKTAAGVAAPVISVRLGTLGTTGDTARATLTFAAQTGVIDEGMFEILANFRSVGSGTAAVLQAEGSLWHRLVTTGLNVTGVFTSVLNTGAGFDSTTVTRMGLSVNNGASASWAINLVQADVLDLT
jgi:hypothetical protein